MVDRHMRGDDGTLLLSNNLEISVSRSKVESLLQILQTL
jgi:hypothetical protein